MSSRNAKQEIINTTIRMIQEKGYNNISTNHIAKETGVSIGTLYHHFQKGKPDIVKELLRREYIEFLDENVIEALTPENLANFLQDLLTKYIQQHRNNIEMLIAIEIAMLTNKELFEEFEYIKSELKLISLISKVLKNLGYKNEDDINSRSQFLLNFIDCIIHRHVIYGMVVENDDKLVKFLEESILKFIGLKA